MKLIMTPPVSKQNWKAPNAFLCFLRYSEDLWITIDKDFYKDYPKTPNDNSCIIFKYEFKYNDFYKMYDISFYGRPKNTTEIVDTIENWCKKSNHKFHRAGNGWQWIRTNTPESVMIPSKRIWIDAKTN